MSRPDFLQSSASSPRRPKQYFAEQLRAVANVGSTDWYGSPLFALAGQRALPAPLSRDGRGALPDARRGVGHDLRCDVPAHAIFRHFFGDRLVNRALDCSFDGSFGRNAVRSVSSGFDAKPLPR